ncbi:MAG: HD domain-containing protein [bacterium]|nr:HD domain-containing protein [bacterium]
MAEQFSNITNKLENFIREKNVEAEHMLRTGFWLRELDPMVDEVIYVSAICHDIERCFPLREGEIKPFKTGDDKNDGEYLAWHGQRSAEFAEKLLREFGLADEKAIDRIKTLIAEHSLDGTPERDLMMDADSISLLENNAPLFIKSSKDKEKLRQKFESEFARLSSEKAKKLAEPFYDMAMEMINKL